MSIKLEVPVLIARKRDGGALARDEITALIAAYLEGAVEEAQMAAFLMAGVIRGFTEDEAVALTEALVASGDTVDLSAMTGPTIDKHSTGGVGDTTTLIVAPALAAAGCQVAKLSGRGLGHTGAPSTISRRSLACGSTWPRTSCGHRSSASGSPSRRPPTTSSRPTSGCTPCAT